MYADAVRSNGLPVSLAASDQLLGGALGDDELVVAGRGIRSREQFLVHAMDTPGPIEVLFQSRFDPHSEPGDLGRSVHRRPTRIPSSDIPTRWLGPTGGFATAEPAASATDSIVLRETAVGSTLGGVPAPFGAGEQVPEGRATAYFFEANCLMPALSSAKTFSRFPMTAFSSMAGGMDFEVHSPTTVTSVLFPLGV